MSKHPGAVALGRLGGRVVSEAKREANRQRALRYWEEVRAGTRVRGKRRKTAAPR